MKNLVISYVRSHERLLTLEPLGSINGDQIAAGLNKGALDVQGDSIRDPFGTEVAIVYGDEPSAAAAVDSNFTLWPPLGS